MAALCSRRLAYVLRNVILCPERQSIQQTSQNICNGQSVRPLRCLARSVLPKITRCIKNGVLIGAAATVGGGCLIGSSAVTALCASPSDLSKIRGLKSIFY